MANPRLIIPRKGRYYITDKIQEPHFHTTVNVMERLNQLSASLANIVAGSASISVSQLKREIPSGTIGGGNDTFTLSKAPTVLLLFVGALKYVEGTHYTLNGATITFKPAYIPQAGATIEAFII